ncbi:MAG: hypothetical protein M1484_03390 [Patescibacteria group bacterium]|nr:hypothetical protein [Patescibacteria group bacterium]MCL5432106.1 hypothetical protein [Patescibacteria group bacterium]
MPAAEYHIKPLAQDLREIVSGILFITLPGLLAVTWAISHQPVKISQQPLAIQSGPICGQIQGEPPGKFLKTVEIQSDGTSRTTLTELHEPCSANPH